LVEEARGRWRTGLSASNRAKVGKNRVHVDISGPDIIAVKARIEALGGQQIGGYEDGGFLVMADPEGNEFCVVPTGPIDFDEEGRTHYLKNLPP
jgi:predicted enzyme related to lactoylglutathione lyase